MNKLAWIGLLLSLTGVLGFFASCLLYFLPFMMIGSMAEEFVEHEVANRSLAPGETLQTDLIEVNAEKHCRIEMELNISTPTVERTKNYFEEDFSDPGEMGSTTGPNPGVVPPDPDSFDDGFDNEFDDGFEEGFDTADSAEYDAQYRFPVTIIVRDKQGNEIASENTVISSNDDPFDHTLDIRSEDVGPEGGMVQVEKRFKSFAAPESGQIQVEVLLQEDEQYDAVADTAQITVYDNVSESLDAGFGKMFGTVFGGWLLAILLLSISPLLLIAGLILFIVGLVNKSSSSQPPMPPRTMPPPPMRR